MLVLTRKTNQSIMIGDDIEVTVLAVAKDKIRLGITAPREVPVFRKEVYLSIKGEGAEGGTDASEAVGEALDELSKGNQQKIQLIAAVLHDPEVLLMDEPFTGLDPVNVAILREAFLELREQGKTLIFSTHQMETVEALCESIAIVDRGRVVVGGSLREIRRAAGRRLLHISVEGDHRLPWLETVEGARILRAGVGRTEVELDEGVEPFESRLWGGGCVACVVGAEHGEQVADLGEH